MAILLKHNDLISTKDRRTIDRNIFDPEIRTLIAEREQHTPESIATHKAIKARCNGETSLTDNRQTKNNIELKPVDSKVANNKSG